LNETELWWQKKREQLLNIAAENLNAYVYDLDTVSLAVREISSLQSVSRVLYAVKANCNGDVLLNLADSGADFDCVSPGEVNRLLDVIPNLDVSRILFTPNFAPRREYEWGIEQGITLTLDSLYPLQEWPELFAGQEILVRIDPGEGQGHHAHVTTAGSQSKFGISRTEVDELVSLVEKANASVIGIHAHSGSGILDPGNWQAVARELVKVAEKFPDARILDLGGGIGVPEKRGDKGFDLAVLDNMLLEFLAEHPKFELWLEPGRFLVSGAGVLLAHVTQVKGKDGAKYIGVSTGINSLIRPALYDAYHEIVNLSRLSEEASESVSVVGPICETGDQLGSDRLLPPSSENDVVLIANAGAYGQVMSSLYNLREVPPEISI
jgi:diaminopimelate decarboxylase/aspartate kinase